MVTVIYLDLLILQDVASFKIMVLLIEKKFVAFVTFL